MKISVSLATLSSPRERYALAWAVPLALVGVIGLIMLAAAASRNYAEYHKIQERVDDLVRQKSQLVAKENSLKSDLDQPKERSVFRKVQFVNGLIDKKRISLTQVTQSVSKLLPPTVRLVSMSLSRPTDALSLRFVVLGKNEEALETFLSNLEESPDFQDFAVSSQGFQHSDTEGVSISCTAQYLGSRAE